MLKVDENVMINVADSLKQCSKKVDKEINQMASVASFLSENKAYEADSFRLKKAIHRAEELEHQLKALSNVLDSAMFEYKSCEKDVVSKSESIDSVKPNISRINNVKFAIRYSNKFNWKVRR